MTKSGNGCAISAFFIYKEMQTAFWRSEVVLILITAHWRELTAALSLWLFFIEKQGRIL